MPNARLKALQKLAGMADEAPIQNIAKQKAERSFGSKAMDYISRPGAATRAAIMAGLTGKSASDAFGEQIQQPSEQAPSGADIVDLASEQYDIENPYLQTGLATAADLIDPTMLLPGGILKKAPAAMKALQGAKAVRKIPMTSAGPSAAQLLKEAKKSKFGSVAVKETAEEAPFAGLKAERLKRQFSEDDDALRFLEELARKKGL